MLPAGVAKAWRFSLSGRLSLCREGNARVWVGGKVGQILKARGSHGGLQAGKTVDRQVRG